MSKYVVFTITLILGLLLACVSMGADEKGHVNEKNGSILIENNSPYEILHIYYYTDNGDYGEVEFTEKGNPIPSWGSVVINLPAADYYLTAEYEVDGEIYGEEQYIAMVPGKSYGWEITEALWSDYQYGASYDYMDYGYMDYGYLAYGDYAYLDYGDYSYLDGEGY